MKKSGWNTQYQKLAQELKSARIQVGLSQAQLAKKLQRPQSFVSKYESGERFLDFIEVLEICQFCDIQITDLVKAIQPSP